MSKITEKIQGNPEVHIFKCYCGEESYFEVMQGFDSNEVYVTITKHPTRLKERLSTAWKALRGLEFSASNQVLLRKKYLKKLAKTLTKQEL